MGNFILESRCRQILDYLAAQDDYRTIENIAGALSCGRNSIQYSLFKINSLILEHEQGAMDKKHGSGMRLTPEQKDWWRNISTGHDGLDYMFTQDERIAVIICQLLIDKRNFSVDEAAQLVKVSRNTLFTDLRSMKEMLASYKVKLSYDAREGYTLSGDEFVLRSLLLHQYSSLLPLIGQSALGQLEGEAFSCYRNKLHLLQKSLAVEYVPGVIDKLAVLLLYICSGYSGELTFTAEQRQDINSSKEFSSVSRQFPELPETEKTYMSCQLLGNRVTKPYFYSETGSQQSVSSAKNLVLYFERLTGVSLEDPDSLIYDLACHISRAIYRYKYGIALQEQLIDSAQHQHAELFSIMQIVAAELSQDIGYPIDDCEIVLLTDYFYNHLQNVPFQMEYVPTLLIVDKHSDQNKHLADIIVSVLPMLQIQAILQIEEFYERQSSRELLISTIPLHTGSAYALIDEKMDRNSRDAITRCYMKYRLGRSLSEIDDLMQRLRPYLHKDSYLKARDEIISFLYGQTYTLRDILLADYIQTNLSSENWEDAVRKAALPILNQNAVAPEYIDAIINSIYVYGSYSYISEGVYLAHAEIGGNVYRLSMGISTFSQPVLFPDGKPVRMLLVMCPIDKHSHFNAFKEIVGICSRKGVVESLIESGSPKEFLEIMLKNTQ